MKPAYLKSLLVAACFFIALSGWTQSTTINGKVISESDGSPLPGVSILIKGTNSGTSTNNAGEFSIAATPNAVLEISYTGYLTQEVNVGSNTDITVSLKPGVDKLDEVVVVGYGTARRDRKSVV